MYAVGIDLGTTFTAAAVSDGNDTRMVGLAHDRVSIPSVVAPSDGGLLVGEEALTVAATTPWNIAREFKRRFGDPTPMVVGGAPHLPEDLTGRLLEWVVTRVTQMEGQEPDRVVLTHPATWGPYKLDLLRTAAAGVGIEPTLIPEPAAAAIHYHKRSRVPDGEAIAVYDLGGGTFDVTILERTGDHYRLRGAAGGLERAGGLDLDDTVYRHVVRALGNQFAALDPDDPEAIRAVARLKEECVRAKIGLSYDTRVIVPVVLPGVVTEVMVQRSEFEHSISELIAETIAATEQVVSSAELTPEDLFAVLLVGGSSRVPIISQRLAASLGVDVVIDTHPKHAVAMGAAWSTFERAAGEQAVDATPPVDPAPKSDERSSLLDIAEPQEVPTTTVTLDFSSVAAELSRRHAVVLTGPLGGRVVEIPEGTTIFGRETGGDVVGLGSPLISRRHMSVTRVGPTLRIDDLGSTNGTRIDGVTLGGASREVEPGDIVDIANTLVMIDGPGARVEPVQALVDSWEMPVVSAGGRFADRVLRRRSDEDWERDLRAKEPVLSDLSSRIRRARRFESPSAALAAAWSTHLSGRLSSAWHGTGATTAVIGYGHLASPLDLVVPEAVPKRQRLDAEAWLLPFTVDPFVPVEIPLLDMVTVLQHHGPEADAMVRSVVAELRLAHPDLPVVEITDETAVSDGALAVVRGMELDAHTAARVQAGLGRARGVLWVGHDPGGWSRPVATVSMEGEAAVYRSAVPSPEPIVFLPSTVEA